MCVESSQYAEIPQQKAFRLITCRSLAQ